MILRAVAGEALAGSRLDDALRVLFPRLSKGRIRKVIDWGGCRIGGAVVRVASRRLRPGDAVLFAVTEPDPDVSWTLRPEDVPGDDPEFLLVDKPAGVYAQRTPYQLKGTVEFAVDRHFRSAGIAEPVRIVHRLDRGTSGLMVFPKTRAAAAHLADLLQAGKVEKVYWALVPGLPDEREWTVAVPVAAAGRSRFVLSPAGREASTAFRVLAAGGAAALIEARPLSGRTHQIRLHLAHGGLPVIGDDRYGGGAAPRMMLHCRSMSFPARDGRRVGATAPLDRAFRAACEAAGIPLPRRADGSFVPPDPGGRCAAGRGRRPGDPAAPGLPGRQEATPRTAPAGRPRSRRAGAPARGGPRAARPSPARHARSRGASRVPPRAPDASPLPGRPREAEAGTRASNRGEEGR